MKLIKDSMVVLLLFLVVDVGFAYPSPSSSRPTSFLPFPGLRRVSADFFSADPLTTVRRSFQDIHEGVGRSMQSLLAAGSALGQRMLGMITRAPRLMSSAPVHFPAPNVPHHVVPSPPQRGHASSHRVPDFDDCDCHFGSENLPSYKFEPISDNTVEDSYGSPLAPAEDTYGSPVSSPIKEIYSPPVEDTYGSPIATPLLDNYESPVENDSYGSPISTPVKEIYGSPVVPLTENIYESPSFENNYISPVNTPTDNIYGSSVAQTTEGIYHFSSSTIGPFTTDDPSVPVTDNSIHNLNIPDKVHEPVIHPGGGDTKEHLDVHKVEVLGAASVVQAPSAQVPDQGHPEKYMNFDTSTLDQVVHHNLWYKDTKAFKHHKHHGERNKVIPHLHTGRKI